MDFISFASWTRMLSLFDNIYPMTIEHSSDTSLHLCHQNWQQDKVLDYLRPLRHEILCLINSCFDVFIQLRWNYPLVIFGNVFPLERVKHPTKKARKRHENAGDSRGLHKLAQGHRTCAIAQPWQEFKILVQQIENGLSSPLVDNLR
jgi:hypothetical protein